MEALDSHNASNLAFPPDFPLEMKKKSQSNTSRSSVSPLRSLKKALLFGKPTRGFQTFKSYPRPLQLQLRNRNTVHSGLVFSPLDRIYSVNTDQNNPKRLYRVSRQTGMRRDECGSLTT